MSERLDDASDYETQSQRLDSAIRQLDHNQKYGNSSRIAIAKLAGYSSDATLLVIAPTKIIIPN
jgi:hypothetical protein